MAAAGAAADRLLNAPVESREWHSTDVTIAVKKLQSSKQSSVQKIGAYLAQKQIDHYKVCPHIIHTK